MHATDKSPPKALGLYLGAALRNTRQAVELNLCDGPSARLVTAVAKARDELDGALWVCEYAKHEAQA